MTTIISEPNLLLECISPVLRIAPAAPMDCRMIDDPCTLYRTRCSVIKCLAGSHESCRELGSDWCNRPNRRRNCRRHFSDVRGEGNPKQCTFSATGFCGHHQ